MGAVARVLDPSPAETLADHHARGGGKALEAARAVSPVAVIEVVEASGLRGRGGAGFPTGTKWRTVAGMGGAEPATVVVNAAEGEPGTCKDRTLLLRNPYKVLEGALIAAHAVAADQVLVGMKRSDREVQRRVEQAVRELEADGWTAGIAIRVVARSDRYLLGEETALLEVLDGHPPFPRIAPPYRAGVEPVGDDVESRAGTELADPDGATPAAATLVDNVETLANIPAIVLDGPEMFRSLGTADSPGTMVCTVSGCTERAGVGEYELGTPLREVLDELGGGVQGREVVAVLSGTANPFLPAAALDAPLSWEGLEAAGGGLGSAGFIVLDDEVDLVAVAEGVSRFLSVESCGQCTPCKQDGEAMHEALVRLRTSAPDPDDLELLAARADSVTRGARCFLAQQHQNVVQSLLGRFPEVLRAHLDGTAPPAEPFPIVPIRAIEGDRAVLALEELEVEPDWTVGDHDSGTAPAERLNVRAHEAPPEG